MVAHCRQWYPSSSSILHPYRIFWSPGWSKDVLDDGLCGQTLRIVLAWTAKANVSEPMGNCQQVSGMASTQQDDATRLVLAKESQESDDANLLRSKLLARYRRKHSECLRKNRIQIPNTGKCQYFPETAITLNAKVWGIFAPKKEGSGVDDDDLPFFHLWPLQLERIFVMLLNTAYSILVSENIGNILGYRIGRNCGSERSGWRRSGADLPTYCIASYSLAIDDSNLNFLERCIPLLLRIARGNSLDTNEEEAKRLTFVERIPALLTLPNPKNIPEIWIFCFSDYSTIF